MTREIPILHDGDIEDYIIVPECLSLAQVQMRVDLLRAWNEEATVMALDSHTWIVRKKELRAGLIQNICELDRLRRQGPARGG